MKSFSAWNALENEIPFIKLNDNEFGTFLKIDVLESENSGNIRLKPSLTQQAIIDKLNRLIEQNNNSNDDTEHFNQPINCSYYRCE